jgi:ribosome assembly protein 4
MVLIYFCSDGKFISTLRGHVAPVYQCAFSADSRLLVTASKDTTLKVWSMQTGKLAVDLPGHQDEVYAVDWSPDGKRVGSGGKDKAVRIWCN